MVVIERNFSLCKQIESRFHGIIKPVQSCFLEYATTLDRGAGFSRIITNPPFRNVRQHMKAAVSLMARGTYDSAVLVGLVPVTYEHELAETIEILPPDTFANASVHTKIIRIEL